jgi:hypothetical protein
MDLLKTVDPTVLAAIAAVRQDEADKRVSFENTFALPIWSLFALLLLRLQRKQER